MGIFFGAEIRQNKDQFYIKIILDLIQDFLHYQILQNVHKKTNIKTTMSDWRSRVILGQVYFGQ